jgi:hypothetical protein
LEEAEAKEVLHLGAIDLLGPVPIERVEGLEERKPGRGNSPSDRAVLATVVFSFDELSKILLVSPMVTGGLIGQVLVMVRDKGQTELS